MDKKRKVPCRGAGVAFGVAVGVALGIALKNLAIGVGVGFVFAIALEQAFERQRAREDD